jgi:hypothetical protein
VQSFSLGQFTLHPLCMWCLRSLSRLETLTCCTAANRYKGFRISFGTAHAPSGGFFARGYKADIGVPSVGKFDDAVLPFTNFTDAWNDATGDPVHACAAEGVNKIYCPTKESLANFETVSIWAEGVEGDIQLEVKSITGYNCN